MMSSTHIANAAGAAATTPMVVPPCVFEGVLRGGVVVAGDIKPSTRWTRGASANATEPVLAAFTQAGVKQDHCSSINNGGGLRTRVEVTHRK